MAYSFRIAYETGGFLQRDLIDHERFASEAAQREIQVPTGSRDSLKFLEDLDRKGVIRPIAFSAAGDYQSSSYHGLLGQPDLVFRDEEKFHPWGHYSWRQSRREGPRTRIVALYSPWQLFLLHRALKFRYIRVRMDDFLAAKSDRERLMRNARPLARVTMESLSRFDESWRPLLLLLVRIQNRYWPFIGSYSLLLDRRTHEYLDPVARERRRFSARRALAELEMSAEEVKDLHERLSFFAQQEDPVRDWWILRRALSSHQRGQLKGAMRRTEDLWEATQALRLLYKTLTRKVLPDVDMVGTDPRWQRRALGHPPRLYYDQSDLRRFLIRTDLYPNQVHCFAEGPSEVVLLTAILEASIGPLDQAGVQVTNLRGVGNIHERHRELFKGFANYSRAAVLVADPEGDIARYVQGLIRDGLINSEGVFIWERNLEEDNFSDAELVRAVAAIGRKRGTTLRRLSGVAVRRSFQERQEQLGDRGPATLTNELLRLAAQPDHGAIRLSKPELAAELAELVLDDVSARGWDATRSRRPILQRAEAIIRLSRGARFSSDLGQ